MTEWKHVLRIPSVDNPHAAVLAFLRTSAWGEWQVSDSQSNDMFVQHFRRGKTRRVGGFFGFGQHDVPVIPV